MVWFSLINLLREKKPLPSCIRYIIQNYVCYLMCVKCPKVSTKDIENTGNNEIAVKALSNDSKSTKSSKSSKTNSYEKRSAGRFDGNHFNF